MLRITLILQTQNTIDLERNRLRFTVVVEDFPQGHAAVAPNESWEFEADIEPNSYGYSSRGNEKYKLHPDEKVRETVKGMLKDYYAGWQRQQTTFRWL